MAKTPGVDFKSLQGRENTEKLNELTTTAGACKCGKATFQATCQNFYKSAGQLLRIVQILATLGDFWKNTDRCYQPRDRRAGPDSYAD